MANPEKGEVSLQIGEDTYTLVLTLDAMVTLEEMFSTEEKPVFFPAIAGLAERGSVKHTRALMWAMFQTHHPEVAIAQVSALVQAAGGIVVLGETITRAVSASAPDKRDLSALGAKPNPPKAQAGGKARVNGTGANSPSRPGAPA